MRSRSVWVIIPTAALWATSPATGQTQSQSRAEAANAAAADQIICRRFREAGSRVRRERICLTSSEWAKLEIRTRDEWNEFRKFATSGARR